MEEIKKISNMGYDIGKKAKLHEIELLSLLEMIKYDQYHDFLKRIFEIALKRADCKANQAIMIGDRIDNDIVPAKKLGMGTIWIKQGFGRYWNFTNDEERADFEVNNLSELCRML